MNILLLGSGGREHALAWKLASSALADRLICAPGNAGIAREAECVALDIADHAAVIAFCKTHRIDFVVVGPEAPLVAGLVNDLEAAGIKAFGPTKSAAQLEGSKGFTKDLCRANNIPTAAYERFTAAEPAKTYVRKQGMPIVVKADGLAAGKGVIIPQNLTEAEAAIDMMFEGGLGAAGAEVVIEEFMVGEEASFFALCDGETAIPFASAQDHKRVGDGDTGPNTGGMGAYSPAPVMTPEMTVRTMSEIIVPTMRAMQAMGAPYKGVLFAGLMITKDGPKLIEYNARFGDPETQVLMLRLMSDLLPALIASRDGQLKSFDLRWYPDAALTVVMAAKGYPGDYKRGSAIEGLDAAAQVEGVEIFHAGTKAGGGKITANGGRVLNVSARGKTVTEAQARAYQAIDRIKWPEGFCRRDIGWQAVKREKAGGRLMHPVLRLYEDSISGGAAAVSLPALARMIFVVHGAVTIDGKALSDGEAWNGEGACSLTAGKDGVTLWRFELAASGSNSQPIKGALRSQEKLAAPLATVPQAELLLRGDSVAFPPAGCAFLHKHWGPGIRCLLDGGIRIDTHGRSTSYGPGSAWYETGSDPVFAQAAADRPSRFIRVMVLPRSLLGKSSFQFVNEEDKARPRVQQYKIFTDMPIATPKA